MLLSSLMWPVAVVVVVAVVVFDKAVQVRKKKIIPFEAVTL